MRLLPLIILFATSLLVSKFIKGNSLKSSTDMARIVEFFGPPGVGKSTIFKEIELRWNKKFNWITSNHSNLAPATKYKFFNFSFLHKIIKRPNADNLRLTEAGNRFISQYPDFMDACWQNIFYKHKVSFNKLDIRFQKAWYLQDQIQKIQLLRESDSKKLCLVDEGVVHLIPNALYKSSNLSEELEEINSIISVIPLPEAIISIDTDAKEIAQRLHSRSKIISMYKNLCIADLEIFSEMDRERRSIILSILESHGVPILNIDSSLNSGKNADKVISFINSTVINLNAEVNYDFDNYPVLQL